jgi:hypothetical protein
VKRTRAGIALLILGLMFVALAPAWAWGIGPAFVRLPDSLKVVSDYKGTLTLFADRVTSRFFPAGQQQVVPLRIHADDHTVPSKSNRSVLVMEEHVTIKDANTGLVQEGVRPDAVYALDRRTCENVPGFIKGIDRVGWTVTFPIGSQKVDYPMWDDELNKCVFAEYAGQSTVDGDKYKNVKVYIYKTPGEMMPMAVPPPGLPATISGKAVKGMTGRSDLPVSDTQMMKVDYFKKIASTTYVEPRTGIVVYVPSYRYDYYVKNGPGQSPEFMKLATVQYARDGANARRDVDSAAKYFPLLDLDLTWTPLSYLLTGLVLIAIGLVVMRRAKRREEVRD